ncbi:MAG: tRNA (N6-isopentenyl adenosine(37)-C2)-methylthiotransferase MiaB [Clostridia bacterium]
MADNILKEELAKQELYTLDLKEIMKVRAVGANPVAYVRTYGCQQNVADGEKIKGMLTKMGFTFTEKAEEADMIIFNTCAIREHAEDRVFGNIGALKNIKRKKPSLIIAVCGCMMEQEHVAERIKKSFPFVNIVFGTHVIHKLPELMFDTITNSKRVFVRGEERNEIVEGLPTVRDGDFKAWVTLMFGCDNFCSYCIVPYVRGREKSRKSQMVIDEFQQLVKDGYKEITLLGQNVNSYGKNLEEDINFAKLLKKLDEIEGDYRIRFMTSHPKDANKELFDVIANSKHICHHIHLPVQSGNDRVLKEMNRKYDRKKYLDLIDYAKKVMPDVSFTSDIIVGFPGENYEEFCDTLSLIKEVEYTSLFTFIFSSRKGTKAETMPDPIPHKEKSKWFAELLEVQEKIAAKKCASMLGTVQRLLVEEEKDGKLYGRTKANIITEFDGENTLIGNFCDVEILEAKNFVLKGKIKEN